MEYQGYHIEHPDDRNRGYGVFNEGQPGWIGSTWFHPQNGLQITINPILFRTTRDAKQWINDSLPIKSNEMRIWAKSHEQAGKEFEEVAKNVYDQSKEIEAEQCNEEALYGYELERYHPSRNLIR